MIDLTKSDAWERGSQELDIKIAAPIHLTTMFLPHLLRTQNAAIRDREFGDDIYGLGVSLT